MAIDQIIVTFGGLGLAAFVAWFFWFSGKKKTRIESGETGVQEALISVKGGYTPDLIVVKSGRPVRLKFHREETASCSEEVVFPDFQKKTFLTPFKVVPVEFTPEKPGEYEFKCGMGMLKGKVIVE